MFLLVYMYLFTSVFVCIFQAKSEDEHEDEILAELQRKQIELTAVVRSVFSNKRPPLIVAHYVLQSEYNKEQRKALLALARDEMRRQEFRLQLKQVLTETTN